MGSHSKLKVVVSAAFLVAFSVSAFAQAGAPAPTPNRKFKHRGKIKATYDKSADQTLVALFPYQIRAGRQGPAVRITAGFTYLGRRLTSPPDAVEFGILSVSRDGWKFDKSRELVAWADGERLELGRLEVVLARQHALRVPTFSGRDDPSSPGDIFHREDLAVAIPYDLFLRIAKAGKLVLQAGQEKLTLEDEHLEALRELASRMLP